MLSTLAFQAHGQTSPFGNFEMFSKNTMSGRKFGLVNSNGDTTIPAKYDMIDKCENGYVIVKQNGKRGLIDTNNKLIVPCEWDGITIMYESRLFVQKGDKAALMDNNRKILTPFLYDEVYVFNEGLAKVAINGKCGFININGKLVIPLKFSSEKSWDYSSYGKVVVYTNSWESIGECEIAPLFKPEKAVKVNVGYSTQFPVVFKNGKIIYIGKNKEEVDHMTEKTIAYKIYSTDCRTEVCKLTDNDGKILFPYERCCKFEYYSDGIKLIGNQHIGLMRYTGEILLNPNFKSISNFTYNNNEYARVYFDDDTYFYINNDFKCIDFEGVKCPE